MFGASASRKKSIVRVVQIIHEEKVSFYLNKFHLDTSGTTLKSRHAIARAIRCSFVVLSAEKCRNVYACICQTISAPLNLGNSVASLLCTFPTATVCSRIAPSLPRDGNKFASENVSRARYTSTPVTRPGERCFLRHNCSPRGIGFVPRLREVAETLQAPTTTRARPDFRYTPVLIPRPRVPQFMSRRKEGRKGREGHAWRRRGELYRRLRE